MVIMQSSLSRRFFLFHVLSLITTVSMETLLFSSLRFFLTRSPLPPTPPPVVTIRLYSLLGLFTLLGGSEREAVRANSQGSS